MLLRVYSCALQCCCCCYCFFSFFMCTVRTLFTEHVHTPGSVRGVLLIPHSCSFFTTILHLELVSSISRIPYSFPIPHPVPISALYLGQTPDPENILSDPDTHVLIPYKAFLLGIVKWQEHLSIICCIAHYKFDVCIDTVCCIKCNFFLGRFNSWLKETNMLRSIYIVAYPIINGNHLFKTGHFAKKK